MHFRDKQKDGFSINVIHHHHQRERKKFSHKKESLELARWTKARREVEVKPCPRAPRRIRRRWRIQSGSGQGASAPECLIHPMALGVWTIYHPLWFLQMELVSQSITSPAPSPCDQPVRPARVRGGVGTWSQNLVAHLERSERKTT
jgi:hypothetical protein